MRVNRVALAAFGEFSSKYSDWPALARILGRMSELADSGEIVVAETAANIIGAVAYIPPHQPKAPYFDKAWPIIRSLVVDPPRRMAGVGRALTDECIRRARRDAGAFARAFGTVGKVLGANASVGCEHLAARDRLLELADVLRPVVREHALDGLGVEAEVRPRGHLRDAVGDEQAEVFAPFGERRHAHRVSVEASEQVFAELSV